MLCKIRLHGILNRHNSCAESQTAFLLIHILQVQFYTVRLGEWDWLIRYLCVGNWIQLIVFMRLVQEREAPQ